MSANVTIKGLQQLERELYFANRRRERDLRRQLRKAGNVVRREVRRQIGPRVTDRKTRRRPDRSLRLGTFTGKLKRSIRVKVRRRGTNVVIFPAGKAFYGGFHERGEGNLPMRRWFEPGVKASEREVFAMIGQVFKVV